MNALDLPYSGKVTQDNLSGMTEVWLIVGPVRIAQHLSNVWHLLEADPVRLDILSAHDKDHPMSVWAAASFANYSWLFFYGMDMCEEYTKRFKMVPSIKGMLVKLENGPEALSEAEWTEPPHV